MVLMALAKVHNQRVELESRLLSGLNKEREESYQRGFMENQALWESWNRRRLAVEGRGEIFNEPPPGSAHSKEWYEGYSEAYEESPRESHALWESWYRRMLEAKKKGVAFTSLAQCKEPERNFPLAPEIRRNI